MHTDTTVHQLTLNVQTYLLGTLYSILRAVLIISLIAGGDFALRHPVEGAEDDRRDAPAVMAALSPALNYQDSVIGIASSGRTPWVLGGIEYAKSLGCYTAGIACTSPSRLRLDGNCAVVVEAVMGPEVVTGSTRMKAGTATKLVSWSFGVRLL